MIKHSATYSILSLFLPKATDQCYTAGLLTHFGLITFPSTIVFPYDKQWRSNINLFRNLQLRE